MIHVNATLDARGLGSIVCVLEREYEFPFEYEYTAHDSTGWLYLASRGEVLFGLYVV